MSTPGEILLVNSSSQPSCKEPVYIITPVYNRKNTTLSCLQNLKQHGDLDRYHVVIIDDGSTDHTAEAIHLLYPEVTVLQGTGDLWWTGAMAEGMAYAYQQGAQYFIWLNDDCHPVSGTLPQLVEFMKTHPKAIAAPTCYFQEANQLVAKDNGSRGRQGCVANPGEILEVDGMSGWCVGIPSDVFRTIGPPDARRFPHYSGDNTYIFRATRAGFKAYLLGDLHVMLVGPVEETLGLEKYFRPGLSVGDTWQAVFWSKKSPYLLSAKFFHCIERYGIFVGTCLFFTKFLSWLGQWAKLQLSVWFQA